MQYAAAIVLFPKADSTTLIIVALSFVALFGGAIGLDRWRRWQDDKRRLEAEWRSTESVAREKGLSDAELVLLKRLADHWSSGQPLKVATTRAAFSTAAEEELAAVRQRGDAAVYRELGVILRDLRERLGLDYVPYGKPIDSTRDLYTGQQVDVGPAAGGAGVVLKVTGVDEAYFYMSPLSPEHEAGPRWAAGTDCVFSMWREDDAVYRWRTRLDRVEDKPHRWAFDHVHGLDREQKREHFRVRFDQTVDIELLPAPPDENYEGLHAAPPVARIRGRVTSLSAGGVAVEVNQALPRMVCLRMILPLRRIGEARVEARIVGSTLQSGGRMAVRAEFVHLEEGAEDRIAKYVLERQQFQIARPAADPAG